MIKYVYASKNKLSGNFNMPVLQDFPKEAAVEAFSVSAKEHPTSEIKELEMFYLGTFDTKTGIYDQEGLEYLIDLGSVVSADGGSEKA